MALSRGMNVKLVVVVAALAAMLVASTALTVESAFASTMRQAFGAQANGGGGEKETICHVSPNGREITLNLSPNGAEKHLENHEADRPGSCESPPDEACDQRIVNRLFDTLYDITLDQDLGGAIVAGDILCLAPLGGGTDPLGFQHAFDITHPTVDIDGFAIAVFQTNIPGGCPPVQGNPLVHATVTSGSPTVGGAPLTEVCIKGA